MSRACCKSFSICSSLRERLEVSNTPIANGDMLLRKTYTNYCSRPFPELAQEWVDFQVECKVWDLQAEWGGHHKVQLRTLCRCLPPVVCQEHRPTSDNAWCLLQQVCPSSLLQPSQWSTAPQGPRLWRWGRTFNILLPFGALPSLEGGRFPHISTFWLKYSCCLCKFPLCSIYKFCWCIETLKYSNPCDSLLKTLSSCD